MCERHGRNRSSVYVEDEGREFNVMTGGNRSVALSSTLSIELAEEVRKPLESESSGRATGVV